MAGKLSDGLLRAPGSGDLALRVSGFDQVEQLASAVFAHALFGRGEKPTSSVEGDEVEVNDLVTFILADADADADAAIGRLTD